MKISALQKARAAYQPKLPQALTGSVKLCEGAATESVAEHRKIFDAIEARDAKLAEEYASQHVKNAYNHIIGKD